MCMLLVLALSVVESCKFHCYIRATCLSCRFCTQILAQCYVAFQMLKDCFEAWIIRFIIQDPYKDFYGKHLFHWQPNAHLVLPLGSGTRHPNAQLQAQKV